MTDQPTRPAHDHNRTAPCPPSCPAHSRTWVAEAEYGRARFTDQPAVRHAGATRGGQLRTVDAAPAGRPPADPTLLADIRAALDGAVDDRQAHRILLHRAALQLQQLDQQPAVRVHPDDTTHDVGGARRLGQPPAPVRPVRPAIEAHPDRVRRVVDVERTGLHLPVDTARGDRRATDRPRGVEYRTTSIRDYSDYLTACCSADEERPAGSGAGVGWACATCGMTRPDEPPAQLAD